MDIIKELTYVNYKHNRRISPSVSPERWKKVYGDAVDEMERRYLNERGAEESVEGPQATSSAQV